jgi:hypothetical protein
MEDGQSIGRAVRDKTAYAEAATRHDPAARRREDKLRRLAKRRGLVASKGRGGRWRVFEQRDGALKLVSPECGMPPDAALAFVEEFADVIEVTE